MHLLVVGLSHKTAPVEVREKCTFPEAKLEQALNVLLQKEHLSEAVILSTCNRTEIYVVCSEEEKGKQEVCDFICRYHNLEAERLDQYLYFRDASEATHHLFRVAASLDSMVVGEAQILGQVKEAYAKALEAEATGIILNRLFREALEVGKRVRTETEIGESAVSISYAAVELAKKVFEDLSGHPAMIIGAGETGELTLTHLIANGVSSVYVTNRTYERAVDLAKKFRGKPVRFDERATHMQEADIVVSSTGAPHYVVEREHVLKAMKLRRNRPIFFIDIAVPRDVAPEVGKLYNVFLYDIDDLEAVVNANLKERAKEAEKGETVVGHKVDEFMAWVNSLEVTPTIAGLKEIAEEIRLAETRKVEGKLERLSEEERNTINALTTVIVNRLLHEPIIRLKELTNRKDGYTYIESIRQLFSLEESEQGNRTGSKDKQDKDEKKAG